MITEPGNVLDRDAELLATAETIVYKELEDGSELKAHVFFPPGSDDGKKRPAMLFFYGSAFDRGRVTQFAPQALHFARRGAVSILFEYRTRFGIPGTPLEAMQDGRSAIRWARHYHDQLGIDTRRIVALGALAGASVVAGSVMNSSVPDDKADPAGAEASPSVMVLYSPLLEVVSGGFASEAFEAAEIPLKTAALIPWIRKGLPPTLILHGNESQLMPFSLIENFIKKMRRKGNPCYLVDFDGKQHSFFNLNVDPVLYDACNAEIERFLVGEGFLDLRQDTEESSLGEIHEVA